MLQHIVAICGIQKSRCLLFLIVLMAVMSASAAWWKALPTESAVGENMRSAPTFASHCEDEDTLIDAPFSLGEKVALAGSKVTGSHTPNREAKMCNIIAHICSQCATFKGVDWREMEPKIRMCVFS